MRTRNGFTYIELISVMVILSIVASVGALGLTQMSQGYRNTVQGAEMMQKAQLALERISTEIAMFDDESIQAGFTSTFLRYSLSERVTQNETYTSDDFTITYDANSECINLIDNTLASNNTFLLVDDVSAFQILYYKMSGTTLALLDAGDTADMIAMLDMTITMNSGRSFSIRVAPNF